MASTHGNPKPSEQNKLRIVKCVADCVWLAVPQATEWQRIGNQVDTAMVFARVHIVKTILCGSETHRTKVPFTAGGGAGKIVFDYVIRRLNALSAGLKGPVGGLNLR